MSWSCLSINQSKWFERLNFVVTQFTSYINERPKNYANQECKEHLSSRDDQSTTDVDYEALRFVDFGGLLLICALIVAKIMRVHF
jgi:hypothetical protein